MGKNRLCDPHFHKTIMHWFDECKESEDHSDIRDAETIIGFHGVETGENLDTNSVEEEDDMVDMENYFYGKGKKIDSNGSRSC